MENSRKRASNAERPPLTFSRKSVWAWVCLMFLICGWMFFIGVLVGRGTAPLKFDIPQIREKLKASLESSEKDGTISASKQAGVVKDSTELDFYEDLKKNKIDVDSLKVEDSKAVPQKMDTASKLPGPVTEKRNQSEAQPPAVQAGTPPARQPEGKPEPQKASEDESKSLTVQVASVRDGQDADRLVEKLQKAGYPAYRAIGKVPGKGIWYRVRVGQYATRADAQKILEQLKKDGQKPILVNR
jgi:DedD protein